MYARHEFSLSPDSFRSLSALVPDAMARQIQNLLASETHSHLLGLGERALLNELRRQKEVLEPRDRLIKARFWLEYEQVQNEAANHPTINMAAVIGRSIAKEAFYRYYITNPYKLAYLLCPPMNYLLLLEQTLTAAMLKIADWVERVELDEGNVLKAARIVEELSKRQNSLKFKRGQGSKGDDEPGEASSETPAPAETPEQRLERLRAERAAMKASKDE